MIWLILKILIQIFFGFFWSKDKISYKNTDAVKYIMRQSINNQNVDSENILCLSFSDVDGYIIQESGNKYLI